MSFRTIKLFSSLIFASFLATACSESQPPQATTSAPPVSVRLKTIESATVEDSSEFVGTLQAKERVVLRPQIEGRVVKVLAKDGDRVKSGVPIVQLRPDKQRAQVNAATASVNAQKAVKTNAEAALKQAEAELSAASASRAQALATVRSRQADVEDRVANLKLREEDFKRATFLVAQGAQSKQQLDTQTNNRDSAIASRAAALEQFNAAKSALASSEAQIKAARERLNAARATVDRENASVFQAQAELASRSEDLQYNQVIAPIDGTVGDISIKVGDYVRIGDELTTLTQDKTFDLRVAVPVERSDELKIGLPVQIIGSNPKKSTIVGQISFISPKVDSNAQAILAKATFPNNGRLRDGQFVKARVIWNQRPGILLPTVAISRIGGSNFVFVAEQDSSRKQQVVRQRPVELGNIQGQNYQVIKGINQGDQIAVSGLLKLRDGALIQPESPES
jgi:RND family efflux transporter MFP subunit